MHTQHPSLGFIGTGTIAEALITGFCERAGDLAFPIFVSPRSEERSVRLAQKYPERVTRCGSVQEVADRAEWVVLAMLPGAAEEVCRSLHFRKKQCVISLPATCALEDVRLWCAPAERVIRMVPLTFNAGCSGPIGVYPPDDTIKTVFGHIGRIVEVESQHHFAVLQAITAYVASAYTLLDRVTEWGTAEGLPRETAAAYVSRFFGAICEMAVQVSPEELHRLGSEATPGGLNAMTREFIGQEGFERWIEAMKPVMERLPQDPDKNAL